jgi:hypothetical protein
VGLWLRHGWHIAVAYVIGFFVLLVVLGWHPDGKHKAMQATKPVAELQGGVSYREVALRRPIAGG